MPFFYVLIHSGTYSIYCMCVCVDARCLSRTIKALPRPSHLNHTNSPCPSQTVGTFNLLLLHLLTHPLSIVQLCECACVCMSVCVYKWHCALLW